MPRLLLEKRDGPRRSTGPIGVAVVDTIDELDRGRKSYARRAWMDAYELLSRTDQVARWEQEI